MSVIDLFVGEYRWLSNFHDVPVFYEGLLFNNTESAYQAAKYKELETKLKFVGLSGVEAKRLSKKYFMTAFSPDRWTNGARDKVMRAVLERKFGDASMIAKLVATDGHDLIEGNYWHDTHFGVCNGNCRKPHPEPEGENALGIMLMDIRAGLVKSFQIIESR